MKKKLLYLGMIILIIGVGYGFFYQINNNQKAKDKKNTNNSISNNNKNNEELGEKDDIYGYAKMSYISNDSDEIHHYKIVELHKNDNDKVLVDIQYNSQTIIDIDSEQSIGDFDIVDDKLYYVVGYNGESIYDYSKLMSINLEDKDYNPKEILNTKNLSLESKSCLEIGSFAIKDGTIYIRSRCGHTYYYDTSTNQFQTIQNTDYPIDDNTSSKYSLGTDNRGTNNKLYINGKELKINENSNELIYDGKTVYTPRDSNFVISLAYLSDNEIIFREGITCNRSQLSCESKYLKYNLSTNTIDEMSNQYPLYNLHILYKK